MNKSFILIIVILTLITNGICNGNTVKNHSSDWEKLKEILIEKQIFWVPESSEIIFQNTFLLYGSEDNPKNTKIKGKWFIDKNKAYISLSIPGEVDNIYRSFFIEKNKDGTIQITFFTNAIKEKPKDFSLMKVPNDLYIIVSKK